MHEQSHITDDVIGVEIESFSWRYPGRTSWALTNLNLKIAPGERVLIAGASGSGKSTLLRAMAGLLDITDAAEVNGSVRFVSNQGKATDAPPAGSVALMQQDPESNVILERIGDDVAFGLENQQTPRNQIWPRVKEALSQVKLSYPVERSTDMLSGGEKQRLGLAGSMATSASLLVLDEPTANLDPEGAKTAVAAVSDYLTLSGSTLVCVDHNVEHVRGLVHRIVVLGRDEIVFDGELEDALEHHRDLLRECGVFVPGTLHSPESSTVATRTEPVVLTARNVGFIREHGDSKIERQVVLDSINFDLCQGEFVAIVGANGVGKSTLARILGGLLEPSSGTVTTAERVDQIVDLKPRELAHVVASVFQEPEHQFLTDSLERELTYGFGRSSEAMDRANELLSQFGLFDLKDSSPFTLSGGEKRRLAVAVGLMREPKVLILDEPTFGQDANSWRQVVNALIEQRDRGIAVVAVTHDDDLIRATGARVFDMGTGQFDHA